MSTRQIVQLADSLVKGWETRIPAMTFSEGSIPVVVKLPARV
ncbi:hypothetical protein BANRA_05335 [Escherichia coli]|nr:hypothetical protein BANRA_05335 [Escherichia coli]